MPSRLPNPESETFFSTGPKYSNVAYKAELSSRAMTDKMAAVVSFCEVMDHRHHPLWVAKEKIRRKFLFPFFDFNLILIILMQNFSHFEKKKRQIYREETTETKSNRKQNELGLSDRSIWNLTFGFGHQSNQSINSRKPLQQIKKKSGQIMTREKFCGYLFRVMSRESAINWLMKCDLIPNNSTTLNCSTVCH
jgi:hypothetical protein